MNNPGTEQQIRQTAKDLFFKKGRFGATTAEIAEAAGVNRALLHYYFRNRERLFEEVLKEAMDESFLEMFRILASEKPFEEKVTSAVHHIIDGLSHYPYIESFIISEINRFPGDTEKMEVIHGGRQTMKHFLKEISGYLRERKIHGISEQQFMVNMMALCAYPASMQPIIREVLQLNDKKFKMFIKERKQLVPRLVLMKTTSV